MSGREKQSKKITEEEFIRRAKELHNDRYDYSRVEFLLGDFKVDIICKKHGVFRQRYSKHLLGQGCAKCGGRNRDTEDFIAKVKEFHVPKGRVYDYSSTVYNRVKDFIIYRCSIHGEIKQRAQDHLRCGCAYCGGRIKYTTSQFIKLSKKTHGDFYDYSLVDYQGVSEKVNIICPLHGSFWQLAGSHLSKKGFCCTGTPKMTLEEFEKKKKKSKKMSCKTRRSIRLFKRNLLRGA